MALRSRHKKSFYSLLLAFAVVLVSFSTSITADAATSYSTDKTYASNSNFTVNGLSLANAVGYEMIDYESVPTSSSGSIASNQSISYAVAHLSFPLTFTYLGNDNFGTFYLRLPLSFTRSFNNGISVIDKNISISSPYESINTVLLPSTGGTTYYLSVYGKDVDFLTSKSYRFLVDVDYYISWRDTTTPSNVGSVEVSSTGFASSYLSSGDLSQFSIEIADGIDGSASMENLLGTLTAISSDTAVLSDVLSRLTSINSTFSAFYDMLGSYVTTGSQNPNYQQFFAAMRIYMQRLQAMISGWSQNNAIAPLELATLTYNRWVSIITDALNNTAPDVTQAAQEQANVQNMSDNQHAQESVMFSRAADSFDDIDLNVNWPSGIISTAVSLMALTGMIWERLGDFQFIAIATLSAGVVITLLGVVNRFPRGDGADFSNDERRLNSLARGNNPDHVDTHWHK